jgi:hypothetical protein
VGLRAGLDTVAAKIIIKKPSPSLQGTEARTSTPYAGGAT